MNKPTSFRRLGKNTLVYGAASIANRVVSVVMLPFYTRYLSPTEYGLLAALARHAGQVIDHRTLLREVWGPSYADERNYLRTFVQRLRSKLEADPKNPQIIVTAGSRGYRLGPAAAASAS